jgi:hypothetical protein
MVFLQLNLRRLDLNSIRRWIYERSLSYLWQKIRPWIRPALLILGGLALLRIVGWIAPYNPLLNMDIVDGIKVNDLFLQSSLYGGIVTTGFTIFQTLYEKISVDNEPSKP